MSDVIERISEAQTVFNRAMDVDAKEALSAFKAKLNEKQRNTFNSLNKKRMACTLLESNDLYAFFAEFKGVAYLYPSNKKVGAWAACGFTGNRSKPDFRYWFETKEQATAYIEKWAVLQIQKEIDKKQKKAEKKALASKLKQLVSIGDVFVASWGWEQTNIEYFKVVGFSGECTLKLVSIGSHRKEEAQAMCGTKTPDVNREIGEVFTKRAEVQENCMRNGALDVFISFSSYRVAKLKRKLEDGSYSPDDYTSYA